MKKCKTCGSDKDMILAVDKTDYSPCRLDPKTGKWKPWYAHTEDSAADNAVRFYCAACGTQHDVPEELK